jgi:hypothetical protein
MWQSRNKHDLIIEVWEKLDCESVGAAEIDAIETVMREQFGESAVDSPMIVARLLADEGAELRHSEIMELHVERSFDRPYDAAFRNILILTDLKVSLRSIRELENLRRKFVTENDREGIRLLREMVVEGKAKVLKAAESKKLDQAEIAKNGEIAQWLTLWLQSPELFENWITLRRKSADFVAKFGEI